jgi:deoxyribodipyrimidine photo-lyase
MKPLDDTVGLSRVPIPPADDIAVYTAHPFLGGETAAMARLTHIIASGVMTNYKATRNSLVGTEFSTKLSAYLAIGCLTARQIHRELLSFETGQLESSATTSDEASKRRLEAYRAGEGFGGGENPGTQALRYELLWRDYMRLCARKFGTKLFHRDGFRAVSDRVWTPTEPDTLARFLSGHTGTGLIDASMRELFWTGYTSNRARQNVASFLAKHLGMDWRIGAEWYECMLVDYDATSNWGNWQYVAGVGNDPREGRIFNPVKQAADYDARGEYIMTWIPELRRVDVTGRAAGKSRGGGGGGEGVAGRAGEARDDGEDETVDREKMLGVFQAWRLPREERMRLGLAGLDWVEQPLLHIEFSVRRPRYGRDGKKLPAHRGGRPWWLGQRGRGAGGQGGGQAA